MVLNYIYEMNAFFKHDLGNQLAPAASMLYFTLLHCANGRYWEEDIELSHAYLRGLTGIRERKTLDRARERLVEKGLVICRPVKNGVVAYTIPGLAGPAETGKGSSKGQTPKPGGARKGEIITQSDPVEWDPIQPESPPVPSGGHDPDPNRPPAGHNWEDFNPEPVPPTLEGSSNGGPSDSPIIKQTKYNKNIIKQTSSAVADGAEGGLANHRELIAELVEAYRGSEGIVPAKGDYSFIGSLYHHYGYARVLSAIHDLAMAAVTAELVKPLLYLKAILERAGSVVRGKPRVADEEEDPLERYRREAYRG